jgi:hypothetical protein
MSVSAGDFGGPGFGGWKAESFSLASSIDWQIPDLCQFRAEI